MTTPQLIYQETHIGRELKSRLAFSTKEEGYPSEEAFFLAASEAVQENAAAIVAFLQIPTSSRELQFQVQCNGRISYQRVVSVS